MPYKDPEDARRYREKNRARYRAQNKEYREKNKEKIAAQRKEYYEANKEIILEKRKKAYYDNIEVYRERNRKRWHTDKEYREKQKEYASNWRKENREYVTQKNREWRIENAEKYAAYLDATRDSHNLKNRQQRREKREKLIKLMGGKCVKCNSTQFLEFDHIDPNNYGFCIGGNLWKKFDKLLAESKKCQLLCYSCHKEKTENQWETGVLTTKRNTNKSKKIEKIASPLEILFNTNE